MAIAGLIASVSSANLVQNPGFETGTLDGWYHNEWTTNRDDDVVIVTDNGPSDAGVFAAEILAGGTDHNVLIVPFKTAEEGQTFDVSYDYNVVANGAIAGQFRFWDANTNFLGEDGFDHATTAGWETRSFTSSAAPAGVATVDFVFFTRDNMTSGSILVDNMSIALTPPPEPVEGPLLFTEDFEDFALADGEFQGGWAGTGIWDGVNPFGSAAVLNPAAGSPWLDPVPAELGEKFGTMGANSDYYTDLANEYKANAIYTLSFTQFRRDDVAADADGITAQLMTTDNTVVAAFAFDPVTTTGTFVERTLTFDTGTNDTFNGELIRIRITDPTGTFDQTGIDNIQLVQFMTYEAWVDTYGLAGADTNRTADVEPDGLDNLMEYALGGNPTNDDHAAVAPAIFMADDAGTNWFYQVNQERTDDTTLTFTYGTETDLIVGSWDTNDVFFVGESVETNGFKTVTNRTEVTGTAKFIRLNVED